MIFFCRLNKASHRFELFAADELGESNGSIALSGNGGVSGCLLPASLPVEALGTFWEASLPSHRGGYSRDAEEAIKLMKTAWSRNK